MLEGVLIETTVFSRCTVGLDVADKLIKLAAVGPGGIWTYWKYHQSRTYKQKMELKVTGTHSTRSHFCRSGGHVEERRRKRHQVEEDGTYCEMTRVVEDLGSAR